MSFNWYLFLVTLGVVALVFLALPVRIDNLDDIEKQSSFNDYIKKFNKNFVPGTAEYESHLTSYKEALSKINLLNSRRSSRHSAVYGLTQFADISQEEFSSRHLRRSHSEKYNSSRHSHNHRYSHPGREANRLKRAVLPDKVDWRERGVVGNVKNQGLCGACWAFSTIGTIESMEAIRTGQLQTLSVQEAIDCAGDGNQGCDGGDSCNLLQWIVDNNIRIEKESDYPLELRNGVCRLKKSVLGVQVADNYSCDNFYGNEDSILRLVAFHGPVTVAVNALSWQYYLSGVIQLNCPGKINLLNHAAQIVGYDLTAPIPHYIIKNTWGTRFGDGGYVYVATGGNVCGIAFEVVSLDTVGENYVS